MDDYTGEDRRKYTEVREIFDQAKRVAFQLLAAEGNIGRHHSSAMLHTLLRDNFPGLHRQDIPILASALERVFREEQSSSFR